MKDPIRVTTLTRKLKTFRRLLARNEWAVRLLGLPTRSKDPVKKGLILVQIEGLGREALQEVLENREMPFLRQLVDKEHYEIETLYSGFPANNATFQAELFYGQKNAIPGAGFRDHISGATERMNQLSVACSVESELTAVNGGLLQEGSSYGNQFSGGAQVCHFCATRWGWDEFFVTINPFRIAIVVLLHASIFLRTSALIFLEIYAVLGAWIGRKQDDLSFWEQLRQIPARAFTIVFLRELVIAGASYDAARGLPIIDLNLSGYDEQARARGPSTKLATWTLKGIDRAVGRLWRSVHRSAGREYDVWVYSGNGLDASPSYFQENGQSIQQAVVDVVKMHAPNQSKSVLPAQRKTIPSRANWLGIRGLARIIVGKPDDDVQPQTPEVHVIADGSLASVYLLNDTSKNARFEIALALVREKRVPIVLVSSRDKGVSAITSRGEFQLPGQAEAVLGKQHVFLKTIEKDLLRWGKHPNAGDLLLVGWGSESGTVNFSYDKAAGDGPSPNTTHGFVLLPCDVPLSMNHGDFIRPVDLRNSVKSFLESSVANQSAFERTDCDVSSIKVLTYNIHACVGMDGELNLERVARVISQTGADVVCLQELDVNRQRSDFCDQAAEIAKYLEMDFHFHPAWDLQGERFGNAILTRLPARLIQAGSLYQAKEKRSKRSALWAEIALDSGVRFQVICAHLSIYPNEQLRQVQELFTDWVQPAQSAGPVVLCGDFNARPASAAYRYLAEHMHDIETFTERVKHESTYFSPRPITRLDHMFVTSSVMTKDCKVVTTRLAQEASDHLPLMAKLSLPTRKTC